MNRPPSTPLAFLRWFCHPDLLPGVEGDLMELYNERLAEQGKRKANRRFIIDVLLLFRPGIIRPAEGAYHLNNYGMFRNYLKVGVRNLLKYKAFSFINIFGLAAAMSVCMLIILMLADQKSYDQFHEKRDRIYRILSSNEHSKQDYATSPFPLAETLRANYPAVVSSTYLMPGVGGDASYGEKGTEMRGYFAEPTFFEIFSFSLEEGDRSTALTEPNTMVISSEVARKLFGSENAVGKVVAFSDRKLPFPLDHGGGGSPPVSWGSFTITGVIAGNTYRSHIKFDVLVSSSTRQRLHTEKKLENLTDKWDSFWQCYTYVLLDETKTEQDLQASLNNLVERKFTGIDLDHVKGFELKPQALANVQLGLANNDTDYRLPPIGYYFLAVLSIVIMLCACLNYTNLSIARAISRSKEIGVRKVNGASRSNLVLQFLSESILTSLLALALAVILLMFIKPAFTGLWLNKYFNFDLEAGLPVYLIFLAFAILIGFIAGLYPAFYLSGYKPAQALKKDSRASGKMVLRKVLSSSQFGISLLFIVTSILIFKQFEHYLSFEYGFNTKNVVNVELQGNDYSLLANELRSVPGVSSVSACDIIPAGGTNNNMTMREPGSEGDYTRFGIIHTDQHFIETLGIALVAGRHLPPPNASSNKYILVNEAAVKEMGFQHPSEIIGQVYETEWSKESLEVIGVVENFRYKLLINEDRIAPLVMRNGLQNYGYLNVKIATNDLMETVDKLEAKWKAVDPLHDFKYRFFDEQLASTHQAIFDAVNILGFIAFLSVTIACLGLLGMASFATERRTKEIGIRKVLGAAGLTLALLLSKEFLKLLLISIGVAAPLSYFINNLWLQNLPNRVEFGFGTVFTGSAILLLIGLVTIGSQTLIASRKNPVDSLRME